MPPIRSEAKYTKMMTERCDPFNPEPSHDSKAGAVNDGEILVGIVRANFPGHLQIRQRD